MHSTDKHRSEIAARVLRAIALNRDGGFHLAGRFLDADFQPFDRGMRAVLDPGPHCVLANGEIDLVSLCIFFDVVLGTSVRTVLGRNSRLATTNIHLRLNGVPRIGHIRAEATYQSEIAGTAATFGLSKLELAGAQGVFGTATGQFAVMSGQEIDVQFARRRENPVLEREDLADEERVVMARADAALIQNGPFISAFWGVECRATETGSVSVTANGMHLGNRVGHLQGGAQLGAAAVTAAAALGDDWLTTSIDASYLRPGQGREFRGLSDVLHRGRTTAVIATKLFDEQDRVILTAASTHARRGA